MPYVTAGRIASLALVVIATNGCSGPPVGPPLSIIDAHIHADFTGMPEPVSGIPETRERLLADMERAGVRGAVAHMSVEGEGYVDLTSHGVIHCVSPGAAVAVTRVAERLRAGTHHCVKIYLGYVPRYATDSAYEPVYALAAEYDVPVVFHTGDTYSSRAKLKYAHPLAIDEVAVDHPAVDFVIAHAGYPWIETAAEIAYKNPNVFIEASAFMVGDASTEADRWLKQFVVEPIAWIFGYIEDPTKLMFGSDWPLVDMASYVEVYRRAIPREHWQAVFHDNAVRVFRMEGTW